MGSWIAFSLGAPAWSGYVIFMAVYIIKAAVMLAITCDTTGFTAKEYLKNAIWPMLAGGIPAGLVCWGLQAVIPVLWWRFLVIAAAGVIAIGSGAWFLGGLNEAERGTMASLVRKIFGKKN